jgi:hypothetical protein
MSQADDDRELLSRIRIGTPCERTWDSLTGDDDRVRHCSDCDLNVYDITAMSATEVRDLLTGAEGRICGRIQLYRRADGTVTSEDCGPRRNAITGGAAATDEGPFMLMGDLEMGEIVDPPIPPKPPGAG